MVVVGHSKTSTTLPNSTTRMAAWHMFVDTISTRYGEKRVREGADPGTYIVAVCLGAVKAREGKGSSQAGGDSSKVPRTGVRILVVKPNLGQKTWENARHF